jgi:hypothetical protein
MGGVAGGKPMRPRETSSYLVQDFARYEGPKLMALARWWSGCKGSTERALEMAAAHQPR